MTTTRHRQTRQLPGGRSHGWDEEIGRVGEISNIFDILLNHHVKPGKLQLTLTNSVDNAPEPQKIESYQQDSPSGTPPSTRCVLSLPQFLVEYCIKINDKKNCGIFLKY